MLKGLSDEFGHFKKQGPRSRSIIHRIVIDSKTAQILQLWPDFELVYYEAKGTKNMTHFKISGKAIPKCLDLGFLDST